jgi:hypothetical protein
MQHLKAIKSRLDKTMETINANLEIYHQRIKQINEDPEIEPEHKQMNIDKFEAHFVSVVGMSIKDIKRAQSEVKQLILDTQQKIISKKAATREKK